MKVAIVGTRGIPNYYGGFEQFAEFFSIFLAKRGHEVYVYCPHNHTYKEDNFKGVNLVKCYDPEKVLGTFGQFIYDFNCIVHSRDLRPDVILNLGYTSSAVFMRYFRKSIPVITNMDGLEWKRSKYNGITQKFIRYSERLAVERSDLLVADSPGIKEYLLKTYRKEAVYIAYGANALDHIPGIEALKDFDLTSFGYNLIIARMEPENNIEVILEGVMQSHTGHKTIVIGNYKNTFGQYLFDKYNHKSGIKFIGPYYDIKKLDSLRYYCNVYFHGHSVGGTNPSLLEAMASSAFVCAHNNQFNKSVLGENALYFEISADIAAILGSPVSDLLRSQSVKNNLLNIKNLYNWDFINQEYESTLKDAVASKK